MPWFNQHFPAFSQGFHHGFLVGWDAGTQGDGSAAVLECRGLAAASKPGDFWSQGRVGTEA